MLGFLLLSENTDAPPVMPFGFHRERTLLRQCKFWSPAPISGASYMAPEH